MFKSKQLVRTFLVNIEISELLRHLTTHRYVAQQADSSAIHR